MEEEFIELVQKNSGLIHKVCNFYIQNPEDKEDLFQEIVLQLWKAFPGYRGESKLSTWIYRIALNTTITMRRKKSKLNLFQKIEHDEFPYTTDYELEEKRKLLYRVINQLNNLEKSMMFLHLEGYNYDEIAEITGLTKTNVSTKLSRIKEKVAVHLKSIYQS